MFILRPILNSMKQSGYVDIKREQWIFHDDTMPKVDLDSEASTFDEKYNQLINGFVDFCSFLQDNFFFFLGYVIFTASKC